jgi:hypothetical protein
MRLSRSLQVAADALALALCVCVADVAARKLSLIGEPTARGVLVAALAIVLGSGVVGWAWRLPEYSGARVLDRFYSLHDGLANALAFAARPASERTPFMAAAIEDANASADELRPAAAVPVRAPGSLAMGGLLAAVLVTVMMFEVRHHVPVAHAETLVPLDVSSDDIDDVRDFLKQLAARGASDETKAAIEELNRLLTDIANQRLDRTEVFRRIEALEMKLAADAPTSRHDLERDLAAMGGELSKADLARATGSALKSNDLGKASDALRELAKKVRGASGPVDKAKLDELRDALKKAAELASEKRSALERERRQLADEVDRLKQRANDGGAEDEERSRLQKKQEELERLDRDIGEQRRSDSEVDRLDRELEQAAEDLTKDLGSGSQDLDDGAEDLNRMNEEQLSQQEKQELLQKLTELREVLRQQAAGGKGQASRLKRFGRIARGQGGGQGGGPGDGQPSSGEDGEGSKGESGKEPGGQTWILGPDGQKILMLTERQSSSGGGGEGQGSPGRGWGEGHDPHVQGTPTSSKMTTQDTQAQGADTGQGGSRSQVILGASERGFSSRNYQRVFTEYHQVAEEALARDDIPGGYRFYVKRYFQLIRPREGP